MTNHLTIVIYLLGSLTLLGCSEQKQTDHQTHVIAHRGYWDTEGAAQNSIAALRNAAEAGVYGSEFDVNLTADGIPIVNHDAHIDGKRIEEYPYSEFADYTLSNGERIPTLQEYLQEGSKYPEMKLILEIKSASTPEHESRSVEIIMDMVEQMNLTKQVEYIAFSIHIVEQIVAHDPDATVAYLNGNLSPEELAQKGIPGLDYHYVVMGRNPDWFEQASRLGIFVNVWTVNDEWVLEQMITSGADFLTTDNPVLAKQVIERLNAH